MPDTLAKIRRNFDVKEVGRTAFMSGLQKIGDGTYIIDKISLILWRAGESPLGYRLHKQIE